MKTLVYYTVGYNARFSEAVELSIETLRACASEFPDILILCDQSIRQSFSIDNVKVLEFPDIGSGRKASMRKLRVFDYPNIWSYDAVVYIDADTIVHRDINSFVSPGVDEGVLYVGREKDMREFKHRWWSLENMQFRPVWATHSGHSVFILQCSKCMISLLCHRVTCSLVKMRILCEL